MNTTEQKCFGSSKNPQTQLYSEYYYIAKILQVDKNALLRKQSAAGAAGSNLISFSTESTLAANFVFVLKVSIKKMFDSQGTKENHIKGSVLI